MRNGLVKAAGVLGLVLVALGGLAVGSSFAQEATTPREQMDQMMDQVHGDGVSQRMREAMGPDADALMDQCAAMMSQMAAMMGGMSGMMGGGDSNMMNPPAPLPSAPASPDMPMSGMMRSMMGSVR